MITSKPWTYDGLGIVLGGDRRGNRTKIARVYTGHDDARLIVTAPRLLEACEGLLTLLDTLYNEGKFEWKDEEEGSAELRFAHEAMRLAQGCCYKS